MLRILSYSPHLRDHLNIRETLKNLKVNAEEVHIDSVFSFEIIPEYINRSLTSNVPVHLILYVPQVNSVILNILPQRIPVVCLSGIEDPDSVSPSARDWVYFYDQGSNADFLDLVRKCLELQKTRYELSEQHTSNLQAHLSQSQFIEIIGDHLNRAFILETNSGLCLLNLETYDSNPFNRHRVAQCIKKLYAPVKNTLPPKWNLYSYSTMKMALIIDDIHDKNLFSQQLNSLYQQVTSYFAAQNLVVSIDVGVVITDSISVDPFQFYDQAQSALAIAKRKGHGFIEYYGYEEASKLLYATRLESDLKQAFLKKELFVVYQPLIDLVTLKPVGIEALIRWTHPEFGPISPFDFLPIIERLNAMDTLADIVFDQAFSTLKDLQTKGLHLKLSININGQQFISGKLIHTIQNKLAQFQLAPKDIELEITEEIDLNPLAPALSQLTELQDLGFKIVIDDFGVGYSSLHYLSHFPVDKIKIDKSFIQNLTERKVKILEAILNLAHFLKIETLVEGIETKDQHEMLKFIGTHYGQGYLFSKPLDQHQLLTYLSTFGITNLPT